MIKLRIFRQFFSLSFPSFVRVVLFTVSQVLNFGFVLFPLQCETDGGTFRSQAAGFPKLFGQGNQQMLLFRGPRFNRTITFDPVMELSEDDDGNGDENHASTTYINVFMFIAVLGTLFL